MRAQVSFEMLISLSMFLAFLIPVLLFSLMLINNNQELTSISQASASCQALVDAVNEVYLDGDGSSRYLSVVIPSNGRLLAKDNAIIINIEGKGQAVRYALTSLSFDPIDRNGPVRLKIYNQDGIVKLEVVE